MTDAQRHRAAAALKHSTSGAFGAGLVLIVLPCIALYFGIGAMGKTPAIGLPILAIFGIMILFGALALVSTLFARLSLSDPSQALALPEGSVRAAIALALIVLFAIISIMLYQSISKPYIVRGLDDEQVSQLVKDPMNHVIAVVPGCATDQAGATPALSECPANQRRYAVHVLHSQGRESTDLAKQLLILIGTLMTSVTSFYFAARANEPKRDDHPPAGSGDGAADSQREYGAAAPRHDEADVDGCDVEIVNITADDELPPARGGVA